jgi:hypothetical protein
MLRIEGTGINSGVWIVPLIKKLLDQGTLFYANDLRHLKIKDNLSNDEARNVEWVHAGVIEFAYGNLVGKNENAYERSLGDGWYFHRN